jgi:hypothetical protein
MLKPISFFLLTCCMLVNAFSASAGNTGINRDEVIALPTPILNEASNVATESFTATWTYPGDEEVTFYLEVMNTYDDVVFESPSDVCSCDVTWLLMGHTYHFRVRALQKDNPNIVSEWSETKTVTTLTEPILTVSPTTLNMTAAEGGEAYATFMIQGQYLTEDVHITLTDPDGVFRISRTMFSAFSVEAGAVVTTYFTPSQPGNYSAYATITSPESSDLVVHIYGTATMLKETPVMNEPEDVKATSFKATWTPVPNVESYTLFVDAESQSNETLIEQDFSNFTQAQYTSNTLSQFDVEGWSGQYVYAQNGALRINDRAYYPGYLTTPELDLSQSGGYVTVTINAKSYSTSDRNVYLTVKSSSDSKQIDLTDDATDYTVLLGCLAEEAQKITIEGRNANQKRALVYNLSIVNGDATAKPRAISEQGDSTQRVISGITANSHTVTGLKRNGTFNYKVQPTYTDGTQGNFSNIMQVTLNGEDSGMRGDANEDGKVDVNDVTTVINYILSKNPTPFNYDNANVNGDETVNVMDVTLIINIILGIN